MFLFLTFVIVGVANLTDYGISWDEIQQRYIGSVSYEYIHGDDIHQLHAFRDQTYGVAIELPLIYLEKGLGLKDTRDVFLMRHLVTHLLFLLGAWCFYLLVLRLYKSRALAVIGFLAIVLHPRIYAHSFFNSKDVPFLALFSIALWLTAIAFDRKRWHNFIWLGLVMGLLVNARIMGLILLAGVTGFLLLDLLIKPNRPQTLRNLLLFICVTALTLYATFPYLWIRPFADFVVIFERMSKFPWELEVLFNSHYIPANALPWYYEISWFSITTPIILLVVGFAGLGIFLYHFLRRPLHFFQSDTDRNVLIHLSIFIVPFLAVIILHSNVYDGWRQVYFIYPAFILFLVYGIHQIRQTKAWIPTITVLGLGLFFTAFQIIRLHPHQQVYFNQLVRTGGENELRQNWEMDYWGASYYQGLEYILKHDDRDTIRVAVETAPGNSNRILIPQNDRDRLLYTQPDQADYFLTNYRWHAEPYREYEGKAWKSWRAYRSAYMTVFKLR